MVLSVIIGFVAGAFIGSSFGIAGFGGAIAGTIPFGFLGAYAGYRIGKLWIEKRLLISDKSDERS